MAIAYEVEAGCLVGYVPGTTLFESVSLGDVARELYATGRIPYVPGDLDQISGVEIGALVEGDLDEVGAKKRRPILAKVAKVAKKVVNNKVTRGLYKAAKAIVPAPYNAAFTAAEGAVKLAKSLKKKGKKARPIKKTVQALAAGKITLPQAEKLSQALGVDAEEVKAAAVMTKMSLAAAGGNAKAQATMGIVSKLEDAREGSTSDASDVRQMLAEGDLRKRYPNARTYVVKSGGKTFNTIVVPA